MWLISSQLQQAKQSVSQPFKVCSYLMPSSMCDFVQYVQLHLDQKARLPFADAPGPSNTATPATDSSAFVDLGQNRRAAISNFKGKMLLNLREYYLKGDEVHCRSTSDIAWRHLPLLHRYQQMGVPLDCSGTQAKKASA